MASDHGGHGGHDEHDAHGHDAHAAPHDLPATIGVAAAAIVVGLALLMQGSLGAMKEDEHHAEAAPPPRVGALPRADVILRNARIHGNPGSTTIRIARGKIVAVGGDDVAHEPGLAEVHDLHGAHVLPGLRDAHGHLAALGRKLNPRRECDLRGATSIEDVKQRLVTWMQTVKNPQPGEWIVGTGWDESEWESYVPPSDEELRRAIEKGDTKAFEGADGGWRRVPAKKPDSTEPLDQICPDNPVLLKRVCGHVAWVNHKALELAKITHESFVPMGGEVTRNREGEPTGILVDAAIDMVTKLIPGRTADEIEEDVLLGAQACARAGLVEVHDAGVDVTTLNVLQKLATSGRLPIRVYAMLLGTEVATEYVTNPEVKPIEDLGNRLTVRAVKLFADGSLGGQSAHLLEPYRDKPSSKGYPQLSRENLDEWIARCSQRGFQVCVHAIGDAANRTVLDAIHHAAKASPDVRKLRHRIEHAQVLHPDDRARLRAEGVIASMQPTHATTDMRWAKDRLGDERLAGAYAWRSLLGAGVKLAFGSDFPVEPEQPLLGLYAAVTRQDAEGKPEGGWLPGERLSPEEALAAFTEGVAYASFAEDRRGRIAEGQDADLTVVSEDPLALLRGKNARKALEVKVLRTYVGGTLVHLASTGAAERE